MSSITVNRAELGNALTFASLGLPRRPVVPVLGGMRVSISSGTLELAAFDYEITARAKVSGHASGPASLLVDGGDLSAAVKSLPKGRKVTAEVTITDDSLAISCDGTESVIAGMGAEAAAEYPQLPVMPELSGYADADAFARSVQRVAACAGRDDTLPVLLSVKVASDNGMLEMAATDRYRLGVEEMHWTGPDGASALVPAVTLVKVAKAADKSGKVSLHFGEGFTGFSDGAYSLITSTAKLEFPKYRALMLPASDYVTTVLVDAPVLAAAVTRAGKVAERNAPVHLEVYDAGIHVVVIRDGKPASSQLVPAVLDGPGIEIMFNPANLAPVLAGIEGMAEIGFASANKPAQVTADGFTGVVMPIRQPA